MWTVMKNRESLSSFSREDSFTMRLYSSQEAAEKAAKAKKKDYVPVLMTERMMIMLSVAELFSAS
jgi:hypothetical protein